MEKPCFLTLVISLVFTLSCAVSAEEGTFEYPCYLLDAYDADNSGWMGVDDLGNWPVPVIPEEWLVGPPPSELSAVTLPEDHWVELKFRGKLIDGQGSDILLIELGQMGESVLVFITDGAGQEYLLGLGIVENSGQQAPTEIDFNMPDVSLPFTPSVIRVLGVSMGGGLPGFDLGSVRVRTCTDCCDIACNPCPIDGAENVAPDAVLSWSPGSYADEHIIYFGSSLNDVGANATSVSTQPLDANSFDPCGLDFGQTYYWRIDEVNDPCVWPGDVWQFTMQNYIVVDDMDDYNDTVPDRIYYTWRDGWDITGSPGNDTGSQVGHWWNTSADFSEDEFVRSGLSMPFYYENDGAVQSKPHTGGNNTGLQYYSEATAKNTGDNSLNFTTDWTVGGVKSLSLWFYGDLNNSTTNAQMYVALEDGDNPSHLAVVNYNGDMNDIKEPEWHEWNISLQDFNDINDVNLANVQKIHIGFGDRYNPQQGPGCTAPNWFIVYFDDIRLYPVRCLQEDRPDADFSGDCIVDFEDLEELAYSWLGRRHNIYPVVAPNAPLAWYEFENNVNDSSGNGYHGSLNGSPTYASGVYGQAINFDGDDDSVAITNAAGLFSRISTGITIAFWQYGANSPHRNDTVCCSNYTYDGGGPAMPIIDGPAIAINLGCWRAPGRYNWDCGYPWSFDNRLSGSHRYQQEWSGQWNHWAFTKDAQTGTMQIFLNGLLYNSRAGANSPISSVTSFQIGSGWYGGYDGLIDDFRIYDYALSQPEIAHIATNGTGIFDIPLMSPADLFTDDLINFRDFAILADSWLDEQLWP